MAEISCKHCGSPDCRGCNIYRLEQMLDAGKLDPLMNENRTIQISADVRPVVRCKDCIHYEMGVCLKIYDDGAAAKEAWHKRKPDDFCSYGERREVDDED